MHIIKLYSKNKKNIYILFNIFIIYKIFFIKKNVFEVNPSKKKNIYIYIYIYIFKLIYF